MKTKTQILTALLALMPILLHAQLKVNSSGQVKIGNSQDTIPANLTVGEISFINNTKYAINAGISSSPEYLNIGVAGVSVPLNSSGYNVGVFGNAGNSSGNYGIYGTLYGGSNGVCVYGGLGCLFSPVVGKYAGVFDGQVLATGEIRANSFVTTSDARLKTNIEPLASEESALENVLNMAVVSYNYKEREIQKSDTDTTDNSALREFNKKQAEIRHYGLLAQELQKIYPNLVYEGQDGYLGVNYVELVPVLIRSIQELKQELDQVKSGSEAKTRSASDESADFSAIATGNVLYQNTPNPFKERTVIRFSLADGVQDASVCIFDMTGKTIKKLPVSSGMDSVSVGGYELGEGMFLYSLIVNGQVIDTKRMVISK